MSTWVFHSVITGLSWSETSARLYRAGVQSEARPSFPSPSHLYIPADLCFHCISVAHSCAYHLKCLSAPWYSIQHVNHSRDQLFLQECNYILSNKTWKGPTSFKMQCVLPRRQGGIPSSWNMLTSLCGRTMGNRRRRVLKQGKKKNKIFDE